MISYIIFISYSIIHEYSGMKSKNFHVTCIFMHSLMLFIVIGDIDSKMDEVLGYMNTELEGRFSKIRSQETNLGNRHYIFSLIVLDIQWSKNNFAKVLCRLIKLFCMCFCVSVEQLKIFWLLDMMEVYKIPKKTPLLCIFWYCLL